MVWDPALIVRLLRQILGGDSWSVSANYAQLLLGWHSLLGTSQRATRALASLASTLGLGEESLDPGLVDEEERSGGSGGKHKVEEDARGSVRNGSFNCRLFLERGACIHLGVKEASWRLNNADSVMERWYLTNVALVIGEDGHQRQLQVRRLQVRRESIR